MIYMICYDITSPRRLRRCAKVLEGYGIRVQKSFFQADLKPDDRDKLISRLRSIIDEQSDKLFCYPLCEQCANGYWRDGEGEILVVRTFEII